MKIRKFQGRETRRILAGMVTEDSVCKRIASVWSHEGLFESDWANRIGRLVVGYFRQHNQAPDGSFRSIVEDWSESADPDEVQMVKRFLQFVSEEWEDARPQPDYLIELASQHFEKIQLARLAEAVQEATDRGDVAAAGRLQAAYRPLPIGRHGYVNPGEDAGESFREAFERIEEEPIVRYPGAVGELIGDDFRRGTFFSFLAPDKTGKSFWLLDATVRALKRGFRVAYFEAGDLGQAACFLRLAQRLTHRPLKAGDYNWPTTIGYEIDDDEDGENNFNNSKKFRRLPVVEWAEKEYFNDLDWRAATKAYKKAIRRRRAFRFSAHPNNSLSVDGIDSMIESWTHEDWFPDLVVIDYADILAPPQHVREINEQIDQTWMALRRLSQERHCLVLTATQSKAEAYTVKPEKGYLGRQHASGRKTKNAHVNGMLALLKLDGEDWTRINWSVRREGHFDGSKVVFVAGCLDCGMPIVKSCF